MDCQHCQGRTKKFGRTKDGRQRFRCLTCRKISGEHKANPQRGRRLPPERVLMILNLLCEGVSIRAAGRITGTEKRPILRLLAKVGAGCERFLAETVKNVAVTDVEADELWTYVFCKQKVKERKYSDHPEAGDAYCFLALERSSKLILAWHLGRRTSQDTDLFIGKLASATKNHYQLSTDGWGAYPEAISAHLGERVDYAQQVKQFGAVGGEEGRRYAPPRLTGSEKFWILGEPDESRVGTSRVERANWTVRTHLRRFTRLSNGFSQKRAYLRAAIALFVVYYNFAKWHESIRMTPAMHCGLAKKPWTVADILEAAQGAA
jgi:IS1 family transposase/transposase-like protein